MTDRVLSAHSRTTKSKRTPLRRLADDARIVVFFTGLLAAAAAVATLPTIGAAMAAMTVYGVFAAILLARADTAQVLRGFGLANLITCIRAGLAAVLAGALADAPVAALSWWLAGYAAFALLLDGLDGTVARRQGRTSRFGARFDAETDAALVLILALLLSASGKIGIWIVAAGLMRYLLLLAGLVWPVMAAKLPESRFRSTVCAIMVTALAVCLLPVVDSAVASAVSGAALFALTLSFGKDVIWLLTNVSGKNRA